MFYQLKLSRWALSISTSAITVIGTFSTITSPSVAQQSLCPRPELEGSTNFSGVPRNVLNAARGAAANAQLKRVEVEREDERTIYEFSGVQNGCEVEVDVFGSGQIEEIERDLPSLNQVAQPARATLMSRLPGFRATEIEESRRPRLGGGFATFYEIEGVSAGKEYNVEINANGTLIEIEQEDEDED